MNDDALAELRSLTLRVESLSRRIDALQVDVERIARTAARFGRDMELRERGYL